MEKERGKIIKVTFEYENVKETLSGEHAEKWFNIVNNMCIMLDARGQNPFHTEKFNWVVEDSLNK